MKKIHLYLYAILSGLLLSLAWFPHGLTPLIFIAFVPLLIVENVIFKNPNQYKTLTLFICSYLTFFTWNILTTWWVKNASYEGAAMAMLCNSLLMAIVFQLFHTTKKRIGETWGYVLFSCFWLSFEYLHLDWDLTYPWLTLGNVFADNVNWVQWYEYTGVFGGSLWVLLVNVLFLKVQSPRFKVQGLIFPLLIIFIPMTLSYLMLNKKYESTEKINVVIVQPNIDPYGEKFIIGYMEQLQSMLTLAKQKVDSTTDYLIFPETALTESIWENDIYKSESIIALQTFLKNYPKLKIITGAETAKFYKKNEVISSTARKFTDSDEYYDAYNTALQLDNSGKVQIYHKSKLVPGVEKLPFPFIFKYFEQYAINLGGTTGSLGSQEERTVFVSPQKVCTAAPVICYESIYGEFVGEYINNGAQFISIITNDGWWGDTPGYKQHLKYGALRAVETRKWIARSANTGVSCFINPKGEIIQATEWWKPAVISKEIELNNIKTFYTTYGDYIARNAMYISITLLFYSLLIRLKIIKK